jgi:type II secretory pathway component GspD/PulD (secretin)
MFSIKARIATAIIITLSLVPATSGQQSQPTPSPAAAPAATGPEYVDFTGFKGKVFDVKYRDPRALVQALRPLGSGFKGSTIQYSDEFRTLTVRDFPENIAAIEEALKRLDVSQAAQPDIELRMHVLIATNAEGVSNQYPADVSDVVKQLQATLSYKSYYSVATIVQRAKDGTISLSGKGVAEVGGRILGTDQSANAHYNYNIQSVTLTSDSPGAFTVQLRGASFNIGGSSSFGEASINTSLNVRSGEKVVVGTATLGNKGLILVLSARVAKN